MTGAALFFFVLGCCLVTALGTAVGLILLKSWLILRADRALGYGRDEQDPAPIQPRPSIR